MPSALDYSALFMLNAGMAAIVLIVVVVVIVCLGALATYAILLLKHHLDSRVADMKAEKDRRKAESLKPTQTIGLSYEEYERVKR